jgi:large subunit ribosomal protein L15
MNLKTLNELSEARPGRKRLGRGIGSGTGKTAGRGTKGAKSRRGNRRRYAFEGGQMPLFRRLPKKGFNNANFRKDFAIVNLDSLKAFADGATVDIDAAKKAGLVHKKADLLKILGKGKVERKLVVKAHKFSDSAKAAIEAAGGQAELVVIPRHRQRGHKTAEEGAAP